MPRLEGMYEETSTAAASLVFIQGLVVLALKSIAMFHGFNRGPGLAHFYESLYLSSISGWKSHTFDAAFINKTGLAMAAYGIFF